MKQQKYIRYILLPTTLLCLIASLFCGCSANSGKISKTGFYFDTMITVTLYGTRDERYWMIAFPWQETTKRNFQTPSQTVKFQRSIRQTASL